MKIENYLDLLMNWLHMLFGPHWFSVHEFGWITSSISSQIGSPSGDFPWEISTFEWHNSKINKRYRSKKWNIISIKDIIIILHDFAYLIKSELRPANMLLPTLLLMTFSGNKIFFFNSNFKFQRPANSAKTLKRLWNQQH